MTRSPELPGTNAPAARAAVPMGDAIAAGQLDNALQQSLPALRRLEELQRLALETTHLAVQRIAEMHERANQAGWVEMEGELMRFQAAATIRFWQQLFDIGMHDIAERTQQLAAGLDPAKTGLKAPDFGLLLGMLHTGIKPIDDMLGASLNRELMPPHS